MEVPALIGPLHIGKYPLAGVHWAGYILSLMEMFAKYDPPRVFILRCAMSNVIEILARLADLWIVGKCKCYMQRSKSTTHIDCFQLEPWVLEELNVCATLGSTKLFDETPSHADSVLYAESLDSLQMDALSTTIRWGATL